jgi:hypothetical protein
MRCIYIGSQLFGDPPPHGAYVISAELHSYESAGAVYFRPLQYDAKYQEMLKDMNRTYRSEEIESVTAVDLCGWFAALSHGKWICITIVKVNTKNYTVEDIDERKDIALNISFRVCV